VELLGAAKKEEVEEEIKISSWLPNRRKTRLKSNLFTPNCLQRRLLNTEKCTMDSRLEDGSLRLSTLQSVFDEVNSERRRLEQDRLAKELERSALSSNLEHSMEEIKKVRTEVATTSEIRSQKMEQLENQKAEKDRLEEKLEYRESIKAAESDQIEALRVMLWHANHAAKTGDAEKYSMELLVQENASKLRILQSNFDSLNSERQCLEQEKIAHGSGIR
jgi:chromosome segregation ATPase